MKYLDGWYWYYGPLYYTAGYRKGEPKSPEIRMVRLWTGTTGRQQVYENGRLRLTPKYRKQVLSGQALEHCPAPVGVGRVSTAW